MARSSRRGTRSAVLVVLALACAALAGLRVAAPEAAKARAGYGGRGYKTCGRGCQVAQCRKSCGKARRTCIYCAKQDAREQLGLCRAAVTAAADRRACKQAMKRHVRAAAGACKQLTGECAGCCRNDYGGGCNAAFADTAGYPGYFRTVRRYGKTSRIVPDCTAGGETGKGPGDQRCLAACDKAAAVAARECGRRSSADCSAQAEAARQRCRAACGETTTTTTVAATTTTTMLPGGSAGCAFLDCDQFDDDCQDSFCQTGFGTPYCATSPKSPRSCDDGNACNGYEQFDCRLGCLPGGGDPCAGSSNHCYRVECTSVNNYPYCGYETLPQPTCDDGQACNGTETFDCTTGTCVAGAPVFCPTGKHCENVGSSFVCVPD
jgi:hypothetical protein